MITLETRRAHKISTSRIKERIIIADPTDNNKGPLQTFVYI